MSKLILFGIVGLAALAVALYFYVGVVRQHLAVANFAVDKDGAVAEAKGFFAGLNARLMNLKTIILAGVATLAQAISLLGPEVVSGWKDLPWAQVFDTKVANIITIVCTVLIPLVHSLGLARAAVATPPDPGA